MAQNLQVPGGSPGTIYHRPPRRGVLCVRLPAVDSHVAGGVRCTGLIHMGMVLHRYSVGCQVGERLQNIRHNTRVSAQSTLCRWSGNLKDGFERGTSDFHCRKNSAHVWVCSQVFVVSANWHGVVDDAASLAIVSARSFPCIPQWEGHHTVEIWQPRSWSFSMISWVHCTYLWSCLLK